MKKLLLSIVAALFSCAVFAAGHVATATQTNVTCNGQCNGSATAFASGGVGPYGYTWTGPNSYTASGSNITGLCAGTYIVTAIDSSDMSTALYTVNITQPSVLTIATNGSMTVCAGQSGTMSATASGGTGAYTYNWIPASGLNASTIPNPVVSPLANTTYTVTVTDGSGCTATSTVVVFVQNPPAINISSVNASCNQCNGSVINNTTGAVTYNWSGPAAYSATIANPINLCVGSYTLTAVSSTGCVSTGWVNINSASPIVSTITNLVNASCGACDGSATVVPTGGTPPYTYTWAPGGITTAVATGMCAGTYTSTVIDAMGCPFNSVVTITNVNGITNISTSITNSTCNMSDGSISITGITGGTGPYTFLWSNGATTQNITNVASGTYTVSITDASGCSYGASATVQSSNGPVITLDSTTNISCLGGIPGAVYVSVSGGTPAYTYQWNNGTNMEDLTGIVNAGPYVLTVTDGAGCTAVQTYYLYSNSSIYATLSTQNSNCGNSGSMTVVAYGGIAPYSYVWNTVPVQTTATATNLSQGSYNCTITDANGCTRVVYGYVYSNCYNVVKGRVYNDANSNCVQDPGELGIAGRVVYASPGYYYGYTDVNGDYTINTLNMNNTVTLSPTYNSFYTPTCPASNSLTVNFSNQGDTLLNNNFGQYVDPNYFNLVIHPGWSSANPGFTKTYWICYYNNSPTPQNALLRFTYDPALQYVSSTQGGVHYPAQNKIEWTFNNLQPAQIWDWNTRPIITFNVPASLSINSTLSSNFEILPIAGDAYPADNTLFCTEPVTGSHDPNSKSVIPRGTGPTGDILPTDTVLFYTIHFQNNGNDTAHFVVVKDTLSQYLDPASIIPGASSHPYTFSLSGQGELTFTFDNIMLPDSLTDEPGSNGYFNYTVKLKPNLPLGTVIENTASIYFDYNEAVVTNTTVNTIALPLALNENMVDNGSVKVYPNPFDDQTLFIINSNGVNETYTFELYDVLGKKVNELSNITSKQFNVTRDGLENGMYFYKIVTNNKLIGNGKLIIK